MKLLLLVSGLAVAAPAAAQTLPPTALRARTDYALAPTVSGLALGDMNGDGRPDIVTTHAGKSRANGGGNDYLMGLAGVVGAGLKRRGKVTDTGFVAIRSGRPDGTFGPAQLIPTGRFPELPVLGDVDGDQRPDILLVEQSSATGTQLLILLTQQADGTFRRSEAVPPDGIGGLTALALGDLDGDGRPEIVSVDRRSLPGFVQLWPQTAGALLRNGAQEFPLNNRCYDAGGLALADVTGDGLRDVVVSQRNDFALDSATVVLPGRKKAPLAAAVAWPAALGRAVVGDLDGDGYADLVAVGRTALTIRRGSPRGLQKNVRYPAVGPNHRAAALADLNQDGRQDLVTTHCSYSDSGYPARAWLEVRLGQASGSFGPPTTYALANNPADLLSLGDVNGDGRPDVVAVALHTGLLSVLLNQSRP